MADKGPQQSALGFSLHEKLGYGAFSFARRGVKEDGTEAALKFTKYAQGNTKQVERQKQEIRTELEVLQKINHPNVLKLYAFDPDFEYVHEDGKTKDQCYVMALEMAAGGELFDIIYYTGKLSETVARTLFIQIASGIRQLHLAKIAHRDIKPQNVLLTSQFEVKIADFGSSKHYKSELMKTHRVGTKGYQAPELLLQRGYTTKCDVFALGVLLFVGLTKHPPFKQAIQEDPWFRQIAKKNFKEFWRKHPKDKALSDEVKDLICRMLCYQPLDRMTIEDVLKHPWCQKEALPQDKLYQILEEKRKKAKKDRENDSVRAPENYQSDNGRGEDDDKDCPSLHPHRKPYVYPCDIHPFTLLRYIQNEFEVNQKMCSEANLDENSCTLTMSFVQETTVKMRMNPGKSKEKTEASFHDETEVMVLGYQLKEGENVNYFIDVRVTDGFGSHICFDESGEEYMLDIPELVFTHIGLGLKEMKEEEVASKE